MKKITLRKVCDTIAVIILAGILISPAVGVLGIFPAPTADLYYTPEAFNFILAMMEVKYLTILMGIVCAIAIGLILTRRMALAVLIILPITINIFLFHAVIDSGIFTMGALMGNVFFVLNLYFLWKYRAWYKPLFAKANKR